MAANGKRGTAIDAAAIPLADGGAEGAAAKGPPSGGRPAYHLGEIGRASCRERV